MRPLTFALLLPFALGSQESRALRPIDIGARKALVIGNSAYPGDANLRGYPIQDAKAMEADLGKLGFQVTVVENASKAQMRTALREFQKRLGARDLALFYFAGHGVQVDGTNYLMPVDFAGETEAEVEADAVPASLVRKMLEETAARVRLLVFDACRNNPYRFTRSAGARGLAPMNSNAEGTAILFGAGDGQTADNNGVFTREFLAALQLPGLPLDQVFKRTQAEVHAKTGGKQFPAVYDQIIGSLVLKASAVVPPTDGESFYAQECRQYKGEFCKIYLERFPNGQFAREARAYIAAPASVPPAPVTAPVAMPAGDRGQRAINPKDGLTYVRIPAGEFDMGCSPDDNECGDDEVRRELKGKLPKPGQYRGVRTMITKPFYLGETEVTQKAYQKVMGADPSRFKGDDLPVEGVSHTDAAKFCRLVDGRLPTEAEWEWAARGGLTSARYGKVEEIGWYNKNSDDQTHAVAGLRKNGYGLYDMLGNVQEWTSTWYAAVPVGGTDPDGPPSGELKVLRGGSWSHVSGALRASFRTWERRRVPTPGFEGFRCVWE